MTLAERLAEFVRAAFTGLWIQSFEHDDAIAEIARLCRQQRWTLATWDIDRGLSMAGRSEDSASVVNATDPLAAVRSLGAMANPDGTSLLVLAELQPVPQQHRGRPGPRLGDLRRQDRADLRGRPFGRGEYPRRTGAAVRRDRA